MNLGIIATDRARAIVRATLLSIITLALLSTTARADIVGEWNAKAQAVFDAERITSASGARIGDDAPRDVRCRQRYRTPLYAILPRDSGGARRIARGGHPRGGTSCFDGALSQTARRDRCRL
jgi:hypothetical protein